MPIENDQNHNFNSSMVQLKGMNLHIAELFNCLISIPLWFN